MRTSQRERLTEGSCAMYFRCPKRESQKADRHSRIKSFLSRFLDKTMFISTIRCLSKKAAFRFSDSPESCRTAWHKRSYPWLNKSWMFATTCFLTKGNKHEIGTKRMVEFTKRFWRSDESEIKTWQPETQMDGGRYCSFYALHGLVFLLYCLKE